MLQTIGRVCYGVAAAIGIASVGLEIRAEQQRQSRGIFSKPPTQLGQFLGLRAVGIALIGKILEDVGRNQTSVSTPSSFATSSFGKVSTPQSQTLRSAFDRGDLYSEQAPDRRASMTAR